MPHIDSKTNEHVAAISVHSKPALGSAVISLRSSQSLKIEIESGGTSLLTVVSALLWN